MAASGAVAIAMSRFIAIAGIAMMTATNVSAPHQSERHPGHARRALKISEYKRHAEECRKLALQMAIEEHRQMLLNMAATWDMLAKNRARKLANQGTPED
jgi:predicted transcriptional regulator